jgi:hypothetical protein
MAGRDSVAKPPGGVDRIRTSRPVGVLCSAVVHNLQLACMVFACPIMAPSLALLSFVSEQMPVAPWRKQATTPRAKRFGSHGQSIGKNSCSRLRSVCCSLLGPRTRLRRAGQAANCGQGAVPAEAAGVGESPPKKVKQPEDNYRDDDGHRGKPVAVFSTLRVAKAVLITSEIVIIRHVAGPRRGDPNRRWRPERPSSRISFGSAFFKLMLTASAQAFARRSGHEFGDKSRGHCSGPCRWYVSCRGRAHKSPRPVRTKARGRLCRRG